MEMAGLCNPFTAYKDANFGFIQPLNDFSHPSLLEFQSDYRLTKNAI